MVQSGDDFARLLGPPHAPLALPRGERRVQAVPGAQALQRAGQRFVAARSRVDLCCPDRGRDRGKRPAGQSVPALGRRRKRIASQFGIARQPARRALVGKQMHERRKVAEEAHEADRALPPFRAPGRDLVDARAPLLPEGMLDGVPVARHGDAADDRSGDRAAHGLEQCRNGARGMHLLPQALVRSLREPSRDARVRVLERQATDHAEPPASSSASRSSARASR